MQLPSHLAAAFCTLQRQQRHIQWLRPFIDTKIT